MFAQLSNRHWIPPLHARTNNLVNQHLLYLSTPVDTPFAVTVTVALGTNGFDNASFSFYPNPTSGVVNITYSEEITNITVINMIGQVIQDRKTNQNQVQIDLSSLPASTYFVKVESNGASKVIKVIKQH